jgi:hypothetical protein
VVVVVVVRKDQEGLAFLFQKGEREGAAITIEREPFAGRLYTTAKKEW